jgi:hypothetical protein
MHNTNREFNLIVAVNVIQTILRDEFRKDTIGYNTDMFGNTTFHIVRKRMFFKTTKLQLGIKITAAGTVSPVYGCTPERLENVRTALRDLSLFGGFDQSDRSINVTPITIQ